MRKWIVFIVTFAIMLILFCLPVFADTEYEITSDGWVKYTRLNLVQVNYKVNTGQNEEYKTVPYSNLKLPYGPLYSLVDDDPISEFWVTVSLNNINPETNISEMAIVQPGETISISWRCKLWMAYRNEQNAFTPIDSSMYSCRIYLDGDYTKYLSPELTATNTNGGTLYYNFTNNTDKPITLSRVTIGCFSGDNTYMESYGYGFYLTACQYRLFTNAEQAAQAVADAIGQQTEDLKDSIENQTDEITGSIDGLGDSIGSDIDNLGDSIGNDIEQSTDQIVNGWDGESTVPDGSDSIGDLHDVESDLLSSSEDGLSSITGFLNETSDIFLGLTDAFGAVGEIFGSIFLLCPSFNVLVLISLSIGLLSFLLGVVPHLVSSVNRSYMRSYSRSYKRRGG